MGTWSGRNRREQDLYHGSGDDNVWRLPLVCHLGCLFRFVFRWKWADSWRELSAEWVPYGYPVAGKCWPGGYSEELLRQGRCVQGIREDLVWREQGKVCRYDLALFLSGMELTGWCSLYRFRCSKSWKGREGYSWRSFGRWLLQCRRKVAHWED